MRKVKFGKIIIFCPVKFFFNKCLVVWISDRISLAYVVVGAESVEDQSEANKGYDGRWLPVGSKLLVGSQ